MPSNCYCYCRNTVKPVHSVTQSAWLRVARRSRYDCAAMTPLECNAGDFADLSVAFEQPDENIAKCDHEDKDKAHNGMADEQEGYEQRDNGSGASDQ